MDRSWMKSNILSIEHENELKQFLDLAEKNLPHNNGIFWYPCKICFNTKKYHRDVIFNHFGYDEIIQNYTK